jgi:HTH-type transcriptional regulator / antitoxin HigA
MMASAALEYPRLLSKNSPAVIHTKAEHKRYFAELERMFRKPSLSAAEQRYCELLGVLIEDYEKRTFLLKSKADPVDVLKELMAANGLQQKDLLDVFKHKALISEIMRRKRPLSVEHIRGLARRFRVSAEIFI